MTTDISTACAYLKRIELGEAAAQIPPGSAMSLGTAEAAMPAQVFSHEAAVFYLIDEGDSFTYVQDSHLNNAGVTPEQMHEIGLANLERLAPSLRIDETNGALVFSGSGNFEASLVLVSSLWDTQLASHFPTGPVAALPARDVLAVCDRSNPEGVATLRSATDSLWARNGDHLLARDLYERSANGIWSVFGAEAVGGVEPVAASASGSGDTTAEIMEIVVTNAELGGHVTDGQIAKLHASGYRWNPDTQSFFRTSAGEPGAPARPWIEAGWAGQKKVGFFAKLFGRR